MCVCVRERGRWKRERKREIEEVDRFIIKLERSPLYSWETKPNKTNTKKRVNS